MKVDLSYLACIQQSNKNEANNEINYLLCGEFECKSANSRYFLLSCNPKVYCRAREGPSLGPILGRFSVVYSLDLCTFTIHFNVALTFLSQSSKWYKIEDPYKRGTLVIVFCFNLHSFCTDGKSNFCALV